jgi:hypothetical protein
MSAVLLTEIADELECAGMDEYAERLRFWDANSDQLGEELARVREAVSAVTQVMGEFVDAGVAQPSLELVGRWRRTLREAAKPAEKGDGDARQ